MGGFAPHPFGWVKGRETAVVQIPKMEYFVADPAPTLKSGRVGLWAYHDHVRVAVRTTKTGCLSWGHAPPPMTPALFLGCSGAATPILGRPY